MASHAMLPIEVFEAVIDQANYHVQSLRQLSLTCKTFLPRCRYHLFSSISIKTVEQMEASRAFLDSHSWVLPLVRKVTLSNTVDWEDLVASNNRTRYLEDGIVTSNIRVLDVAPAHLLQLPNLRTWKMTTDVKMGKPLLSLHRRTLLSYKRYGRLMQDLELHYITFDTISDFRGLVSAFTGLQNLTCSSIWFRTMEAFPDSLQTNILAMPLKIKTLCVDIFTDLRAVEYLASNSATLSGLVLTLTVTFNKYNNFERLEMLTDKVWLSQLSSLTLVVECDSYNEKLFNVDHFPSQAIDCATSFFRHVRKNHLREARIEFTSMRVYMLALLCYSLAGTPLEACRSLEEALLALPRGTILFQFRGPSRYRRAGRRELWSSSIQNAFPQATRRGILTIDYHTPGPRDSLGHEAGVRCLLISYDSKHAATTSFDGLIIVWDLERDTVAQQWVGHGGHGVESIALSPNCPRLLSASGGGGERLVVWDFGNGVQRVVALESNTATLSICAWSPDGTLIASGSADGTVRVWCAVTFKQHGRLDDPDAVSDPRSLQFSPNARCLGWISNSPENGYTCSLWRPLEEDQLTRVPSHSIHPTIPINAFAFDPQSTRIATAHGDKDTRKPEECVVRIWDVTTGAALVVLSGHTRRVQDVAFSPGTGGLVLSASSDGTARLWDLPSGTQIVSLVKKNKITPHGKVLKACFSPDGEYIAIASNIVKPSAGVELRRAKDGSCVGGSTGHRLAVSHIAFSPNGEFLATGDQEGRVRIHRTSNLIRD